MERFFTAREAKNGSLIDYDAAVIKKWFIETIEPIEQNVNPETRTDMVCVSSIAVCVNYANAVLDLIRSGHNMPAKALLRVLCETVAKIAWCLVSPKNKKKDRKQAVERKFDQWEKDALYKKLRILYEFRSIVSSEQSRELEDTIRKIKLKERKFHAPPMPKTIEIFNKLSSNWRSGVYPRGFLQFNDAVHIDIHTLLSRIYCEEGGMNISHDSNEELTDLSGYCLSFMFQLFYLVRTHFGLDTTELLKEFQSRSERFEEAKPEKSKAENEGSDSEH
ncbi:hypothetical protein L21SP3_00641 [Sedimentisphaera cyanobacteriorum]|uniref:Uncharacterized protein n=1 Tax=Sedimentisphaera cyanobacteriorum TaxID=1940790 RepID=A0A1Q2HMT5_9BACT|nr:DUF5677 domain-containing protein [Sedimentisphaera cyanobacteriorum]AQQ08849.1 hypothetical protein L21SP3_00641 [Sedimentisphaera cyanobacteriorum]